MTVHRIGGRAVISATIREPKIGVWTADVVLAGTDELTGAVEISLSDGAALMRGTVLRSGLDSGRSQAKIVGGTGGIYSNLAARFYGTTTIGTILRDLMADSGETLDSSVQNSVKSRAVTHWQRPTGSGGHSISDVALEAGVSWRILRNGNVWLGAEAWPELKFDHTELKSSPEEGKRSIAPKEAPLLRPGVTFESERVSTVITRIGNASTKQEYYVEDTNGAETLGASDRVMRALKGLVDYFVARKIDFSHPWTATVIKQHADLTVDVVPDSPHMKGTGCTKIKIRHGLPGVKVRVVRGSKVLLMFENADPSLPFVALWEPGSIESIDVADGTRAAAAQGDQVMVNLDVETITALAPHILSPTGACIINPASLATLPLKPIFAPGTVASGTPKFRFP